MRRRLVAGAWTTGFLALTSRLPGAAPSTATASTVIVHGPDPEPDPRTLSTPSAEMVAMPALAPPTPQVTVLPVEPSVNSTWADSVAE